MIGGFLLPHEKSAKSNRNINRKSSYRSRNRVRTRSRSNSSSRSRFKKSDMHKSRKKKLYKQAGGGDCINHGYKGVADGLGIAQLK